MLVFCKGPNILKKILAKKLKGVKLAYLKHLVQLTNLLWASQNDDLTIGLQHHISLWIDNVFPIWVYVTYNGTPCFSA